ncbi:NAD(P)H-quinone oxidoreductase [Spirosoma koreense]
MKAIVITRPGGPEVLSLQDYPTPEPDQDEVLIEVRAAGLNRSDVFQREGHYPAPTGVPADIPGLEVAGVVVKCGPAVQQWQPGDAVCALLAGGGYADCVAVREGQCLPLPHGWTFAQAASLPETVFTVWSNVFQRGKLQAGENLLVHGGSSGIGITAIQLGKALGARVFVTVGSDDKGRACLALGAHRYVNYKTQDFEQAFADEGIDVVLDMVGGSYLSKNLHLLRPEGRLVYINTIEAPEAQLNLRQIMQKRLTLTGSTLRNRDYTFKKSLAADVYRHVWPLLESGKFTPVIHQTFPFAAAQDAHRLMESNQHIGKIILVNE